MTTNVDIANRALAEVGARAQLTSFTDGSPNAIYSNLLYNPLRDFLLREGDYDFAMKRDTATAQGTAPIPWIYAWTYPSTAIRIRQLVPTIYVALDPKPLEWNIIGTNPRLIYTKDSISSIIYTYPPVEDLWDPLFTESFVRLLASALAFAIENRIEASKEKLSEALSFAGIANMRDS